MPTLLVAQIAMNRVIINAADFAASEEPSSVQEHIAREAAFRLSTLITTGVSSGTSGTQEQTQKLGERSQRSPGEHVRDVRVI
jgi:hypothetical protein